MGKLKGCQKMKQNLFCGVFESPEAEELQQAWDNLWKSADKLVKNLKKEQKQKRAIK